MTSASVQRQKHTHKHMLECVHSRYTIQPKFKRLEEFDCYKFCQILKTALNLTLVDKNVQWCFVPVAKGNQVSPISQTNYYCYFNKRLTISIVILTILLFS